MNASTINVHHLILFEFDNYLKAVNIKNTSSIPEHPESNAVVENFKRSLKKLICASKFENKNWKNEISPAKLIFNRKLKSYVPHKTIRKTQRKKYKKGKQYTDEVRKPAERTLQIGDKVLMRRIGIDLFGNKSINFVNAHM